VLVQGSYGLSPAEIHRNWHDQPDFSLKQRNSPFSPSEVRLVSNAANLTLPASSSPAFDGKPGIVWMTYTQFCFFTIEMPSATMDQLFT